MPLGGSAIVSLTRRELLLRAAYVAPVVLLTGGAVVACEQITTAPSPQRRAAFVFYGINTHLSFLGTDTVWANTDAAVDWLLELGVGAVRQSLPRTAHGRGAVKKGMKSLGAQGVRWCCPILDSSDITTLKGARRIVNEQLDWLESNTDLDLLDSLPGLNEPNSQGKAILDWARVTRWAQQALYEETRKRPAFDHVLVQGPPLNMKGGANEIVPDVQELGDLSRWLDRGDAHIYPGDDDPEVTVEERLALLAPVHPGKPVCISEGGYTTSVDRGYTGGAVLVSEEAAALYGPKQLLVHAAAGRTFFSYELLDEAPPLRDTERSVREAGFGLVRTPKAHPGSWQAKPGFEAIQRLLTLVRDVSPDPAVPLSTQVSAATADVRTALMHRSDGKWLLAIWRAVDLYIWDRDTRTGKMVAVAPEDVTVTLDGPRLVVVHRPSLREAPTDAFVREVFTLSVGADLWLLEIG